MGKSSRSDTRFREKYHPRGSLDPDLTEDSPIHEYQREWNYAAKPEGGQRKVVRKLPEYRSFLPQLLNRMSNREQ
jgi:hypothetical protein